MRSLIIVVILPGSQVDSQVCSSDGPAGKLANQARQLDLFHCSSAESSDGLLVIRASALGFSLPSWYNQSAH